jgi:hypothetical protein
MASDSAAWQQVLQRVVLMLRDNIVEASLDSMRQPWTIRVPADDPQSSVILAQLTRILRARPPQKGDSVGNVLELSRLQVSNDTARLEIKTTFSRPCRGAWRTPWWTNTDSIFVPRHRAGFWMQDSVRNVYHGDGGCAQRQQYGGV